MAKRLAGKTTRHINDVIWNITWRPCGTRRIYAGVACVTLILSPPRQLEVVRSNSRVICDLLLSFSFRICSKSVAPTYVDANWMTNWCKGLVKCHPLCRKKIRTSKNLTFGSQVEFEYLVKTDFSNEKLSIVQLIALCCKQLIIYLLLGSQSLTTIWVFCQW